MKNLFYLLLALLILSSCNENSEETVPDFTRSDSISMGAGYANDIYYSLKNGIVSNASRSGWDIAFSTDPMSSTIIINEGYGLKLYAYPNGNLDAWDNIDTTGLSQWPTLFNADTSWMFGAFDRNSLGHPDYGWGVYNDLSHDVTGDSLFIIKLSDGSYKKLLIEKRAAMTNTFHFKYGDLNAAGESQEIVCSNYISKNFIYFSIVSGNIMDNEPKTDEWDLVFTKYHDESIPYIVTGILSNINIETAEVRGIDTDLADPESAVFTSSISEIGSDWKTFDMGSFSYIIENDLCYFVKTPEEEMYKIIFTATDGSASGKIVFKIEKLSSN
ncbi:MAG: hypothetical protein DRI73_02290 [Bacteroidetes bacterium]|nr:MAG: hypothetical protein DRI73_02290 [Bacteroidota bacterium]